jgi:hypothetical protein
MGEYKETCPYCGNKFNMIDSVNHSLCSEYYFYLLSEKIAYAKHKLEILFELQKTFQLKK